MMVYLGVYHESKRCESPHLNHIFTHPSYELTKYLRMELLLPDFHYCSLNRAWSLVQGFSYSPHGKCGNEACKGLSPTDTLCFPDGMFSVGICKDCKRIRTNRKRREAYADLTPEERKVVRAKAVVAERRSRAQGVARKTEQEEKEFRTTKSTQNNASRAVRKANRSEEQVKEDHKVHNEAERARLHG